MDHLVLRHSGTTVGTVVHPKSIHFCAIEGIRNNTLKKGTFHHPNVNHPSRTHMQTVRNIGACMSPSSAKFFCSFIIHSVNHCRRRISNGLFNDTSIVGEHKYKSSMRMRLHENPLILSKNGSHLITYDVCICVCIYVCTMCYLPYTFTYKSIMYRHFLLVRHLLSVCTVGHASKHVKFPF